MHGKVQLHPTVSAPSATDVFLVEVAWSPEAPSDHNDSHEESEDVQIHGAPKSAQVPLSNFPNKQSKTLLISGG